MDAEKTTEETEPKGDVKPEESLRAVLAEFEQNIRQTVLGQVEGIVRDALTPDRSKAEQIEQPRQPYQSAARVRPAIMQRYEQLWRQKPETRDWRNPQIDGDMKRFILASMERDWQTVRAIQLEYGVDGDGFDPMRGERATLQEGALGESGGDGSSGLSAGSAGPLIPLPLANTIILARNVRAKARARVNVFTTDARTMRVPGSGVATVGMVAEGASGSQTEPTTTSTLLSKKKMRAKFRISEEALEDSSFNIVSWFAERAGSALGAEEDTQVATSDGVAPNFTGSFDLASIASFAEATPGTMTYADVVDLFFTLPEAYQETSTWFGNSAMMGLLSKLVDGNGRPIFTSLTTNPEVVGDRNLTMQPGTRGFIFGRPVISLPVDAGGVYVGDLSYYGFLEGGGIRMRVLDQVAAATDDIEFRFTQRVDGEVLLADAFRSMDGITAVA